MPTLLTEVDLLSPADAAQVLGLSVDMVRVLARDGRLPTAARSVRGVRLFRRADVEELASERAGQAACQHSAQFYERDDFLCRVLAGYVGEGLRSGASCIVIATPPHRQALSRRLADVDVDVRLATRSGQLVLLDAEQTLRKLMSGHSPDRHRFRTTVGAMLDRAHATAPRTPVRAFGEMVDLLWKDARKDAALDLEDLWSELGRDVPFRLLCAYDMAGFRDSDTAPFDAVCAHHTRVLPAESFPQEGPPDARLREIARLQQRAQALEDEVSRRAQAEEALRRGEQELRVQNDRLAEALRAKDEFLAMLGHELRNPLAPILAALQLVRRRGEESREIEAIERQARHMVRLVDDLLDVSRLLRGAVNIRPRRVELAEVVERALELSASFLEGRRADLEVRVPQAGLPVCVDVERMTQVVSNLLVNAAKYSDAGSRILVSARGSARDVVLRVKDHGIGISPELIERVFEPFVQQPQALDRAKGGLGLGLAIVRNIVQLHGGTVNACSEGVGKGAELTVTLPPAEPATNEAARPGEDAPGAADVAAQGPKRILIVDDNEDSATLLGELLEMLGHEVKVAHDGASALDIATRFVPEVALLDIGLPGMDGYELGRRLRAASGTLRLLAVSGYGDGANRARSAEAGFEAHLVKPVPIDRLVEMLGTS
jgi:signal transduction histidine kinase